MTSSPKQPTAGVLDFSRGTEPPDWLTELEELGIDQPDEEDDAEPGPSNVVPFPTPTPAATAPASAAQTCNSLSDVPEGGAYVFDAFVRGPLDPALLARQLTFALSMRGRDAKTWNNHGATFGALLERLCRYRYGAKDGSAMCQGPLVSDGQRLKTRMRAMVVLGYDIDTGETLDEVERKIAAVGLCAALWNTFSHNSERTFILEKNMSGGATVEAAVQYFMKTKHARPELFEGARLSERTHESEGIGYWLSHKPWPKVRVFLLLEKPFVFLEHGATHLEAMAKWSALYLAVAALLGFAVDESCADPSRLFYIPRIPEGTRLARDGVEGAAAIHILPGKALDLAAVQLPPEPEKPEKPATPEKTAAPAAPAEGLKTANLKRFHAIGARSFKVAGWLRDTQPQDVLSETDDGTKIHLRCPLEHLHTETKDGDTAFYVISAGADSGYHALCMHATCRETCKRANGKHDRGVMLDALCVRYGVADAAELLKWCDDAAREKWDSKPGEDDLTNYAAAHTFAERYSATRRYNHTARTWMTFDGLAWRADQKGETLAVLATMCAELGEPSTRFFRDTEAQARNLPEFSVTADAFDQDDWLLATPGGYVDLRTGQMSPPDPGKLVSCLTTVAPAETPSPQWVKFLREITNAEFASDSGDIIWPVADYLQRLFGYCLTGVMREQMMAFILGPPGTGKSTLVQAVQKALGDYARAGNVSALLTPRNGDPSAPQPFLVGLNGARLAAMPETKSSMVLDVPTIARITGEDRIATRDMHGKAFDMVPKFKVILYGNQAPAISGSALAIERRLHVVPLSNVFKSADSAPGSANLDLAKELENELGGILRWAIEGCLLWQKDGELRVPKVMREALTTFMRNSDHVSAWAGESLIQQPGARLWNGGAYSAWKDWALAHGYEPGAERSFSDRLTDAIGCAPVPNPSRSPNGRSERYRSNWRLRNVFDE